MNPLSAWVTNILNVLPRKGVSRGAPTRHTATPDRSSSMSLKDIERQYERPPSFINQLQFVNYNPDYQCFGFADGISVGAALEVTPIDAESRPPQLLEQMLSLIESAFSIIPELEPNPWVVQLYSQDEPVASLSSDVERYVAQNSTIDNALSAHYCSLMADHLKVAGKQGGIFKDTKSGARWNARYRRTRIVLYRDFSHESWPSKSGKMPYEEIQALVKSLSAALEEISLATKTLHGGDLVRWLFPWFNPSPPGFTDAWEFLDETQSNSQRFEWDYDLAQGVVMGTPANKDGHWYFNERPHHYVPILGCPDNPVPGKMMLETGGHDKSQAAIFDRLPQGSVLALTIVITPQDSIASELEFVKNRSQGRGTPQAAVAHDDVCAVQNVLPAFKLYPTSMGVFVTAESDVQLSEVLDSLFATMNAEGVSVVLPDVDLVSTNAYVNHLPMSYRPSYDTVLKRSRLEWLHNTLALSPLLGQSVGTPNPGFIFYNRSGQPLLIDPLNGADRERAAHMLLLGPTGAGKSATVVYLLLQVLAVYQTHIYVFDVGDSFRLFGDYIESMGLKVNYINLDKGNFTLPPFANSPQVLNGSMDGEKLDDIEASRDYLSEMEAAAKLMITGGEIREIEQFRRHDSAIVKAAIKWAAKAADERGDSHATVSDFVAAFDAFIGGAIPPGYGIPLTPETNSRLEQMRDAARPFCEGIRGKLFNGYGADLPDCDMTIIDLAKVATNPDFLDVLNLSLISLMNTIQSQAEARRGSGRQSIVMIDEAHITTVNPLFSDYLAKGSKMWRKWGLWLWMATQNMSDFPDAAQKILNMAEFWWCLSMPLAEIDEIARFKQLTEEDRALLISARKQSGSYVEGVLLSSKKPMLFRNVPPALALSLAQTEESEVAMRQRLMSEYELESELDAVYKIAELINEARLAS